MCGICGYINTDKEKASKDILRNMTDAIAHRGPDGEGQFVHNNVALGHRRLAILDLTNMASQPMISEDKNYILTYNGEVYNFRELRKDLIARGYSFSSTGDTEVLLKAYMEWGKDCLYKLNGMFAFAIYNKKEHMLFCARDRYGIKPFYYAVIGNCFIFGSEQKAIYTHPQFEHELDYDAIAEYFTFQNILSNRTFEKRIKILEPGHYFVVRTDEPISAIHPIQYWDFNFEEIEKYNSEEEYEEELDAILSRSINRQLVSDAPVGCFLSGGMDSGTITCVASRKIPRIHTFTCGYDMSRANSEEKNFDERKLTEIMAHAFQTSHFERILQPSDVGQVLSQVCFHNEEPRVGMTYTNYTISELASKFVKVCFSGTGGDELFGGYPWRYYRGMMAKSFDDFAANYYTFWQRLIPTPKLMEALSPVKEKVSVNPKELFKQVLAGQSNHPKCEEDYINCMMYYEAKTFLHGMLMIEDKQTMAHSLESRVPMLDNELVDFGMKLPIRYKLSDMEEAKRFQRKAIGEGKQDAYIRTNRGKYLLRKCMYKYIPEEIAGANKQGFSAPDATWFRDECAGLVRDVIYNDKARMWDILDKKLVQAMVDEHMNNKVNRRLLVWSLLSFEEILNRWF